MRVVEVLGSTYNLRFERRLHIPGFDPRPVDAAEERMCAHVLLSARCTAETLSGVLHQERFAGVFRFLFKRLL